jgi:hypothetical protein
VQRSLNSSLAETARPFNRWRWELRYGIWGGVNARRSHGLRCVRRAVLLGSSALLMVTGFGEAARAQVELPQVVVSGAKPKAKPHPVRRRTAAPTAAPPAAVPPINTADVKNNEFDNARTNLYTTVGTNSNTISHDAIVKAWRVGGEAHRFG